MEKRIAEIVLDGDIWDTIVSLKLYMFKLAFQRLSVFKIIVDMAVVICHLLRALVRREKEKVVSTLIIA